MVTQFFAPVPGGEERLVEDLRGELGARGHHVSVATTTDSTAGPFEGDARLHCVATSLGRIPALHADGVRPHSPPFPDPEALLSLRRIIDEERPDIVHGHNWLVHSLPPLRRRGIPLVVTLHDYGLVCATKRLTRAGAVCPGPRIDRCLGCARVHFGALKGPPTAALLRPASAALRRRADLFLPISDAVAEHSGLQRSGVPFEVIPNFVPDRLFEAPRRPGAPPGGLPAGDFLAFAGDLAEDKGIGPLLDAHARTPGAPPLVLVGRRVVDGSRLDRPGVHVLGPRPHAEVMEVFRRSLAVFVPSVWSEPFGLVAIEAMAAGRPVVASAVGGLRTLVDDGVTGILTPPGDVEALSAAMSRLCGSPGLREEMGAAAARRARRFAASAVVPRVEAAYGRVLQGSRRGAGLVAAGAG